MAEEQRPPPFIANSKKLILTIIMLGSVFYTFIPLSDFDKLPFLLRALVIYVGNV